MLRRVLASLILFFLVMNIVDVVASNRPLFHQLRFLPFVTAPLNVASHLGTPGWLWRDLLRGGGILRNPTPQVFPNIQRLRDAFSIIQEEAMNAYQAAKPIKDDLFFQGIADDGWKRFYIKWYGPTDRQARILCPLTSELLESMPEVHLAMFSILMPGSVITPHCGPTRMCLRYHLGLFTPNDDKCFIRVGTETYSWRDGEDVMFDDTRLHEVKNLTDKPRVILFLDVERPQQGPFAHINRAMIRYAGPATTRSNDTQEVVTKQPFDKS